MDLIKSFSNLPLDKQDGIVRVLSIDLGTTNSTVAESVLTPGYPALSRVVELPQPLPDGTSFKSALVPSLVVADDPDTFWIGEAAKRLRSGAHQSKHAYPDVAHKLC